MIGRPNTPTAMKIAAGNPGRRPLPENEVQPTLGKPKCPSWMQGNERKTWTRLSKELSAMKVLTLADRDMLIPLVVAICELEKAVRKMNGDGTAENPGEELVVSTSNGGRRANPLIGIIKQNQAAIKDLGSHFGMSPASRVRIKAPPKEKENNLEAFQRQESERRKQRAGKIKAVVNQQAPPDTTENGF